MHEINSLQYQAQCHTNIMCIQIYIKTTSENILFNS